MAYELLEHPSANDPEGLLQHFRTLRGRSGQLDEGIFIAESPKIVERVLASQMGVDLLYATAEFVSDLQPLLESRPETVRVVVAPKEEMEKVVGYHLHQGVMLAAKVPSISEHAEVCEIVEFAKTRGSAFTIVALDSIADPENMGGIIRTCAAFGVDAMLVDKQSCHPFLRRSVRVSMGNIVNLPIFRVEDLHETLRGLKQSLRSSPGVTIFGAALTPESVHLEHVPNERPRVLLFGSEGVGIRPSLMELCDSLVEIPMAKGVSSLNVGVACGVVLYKFLHSR